MTAHPEIDTRLTPEQEQRALELEDKLFEDMGDVWQVVRELIWLRDERERLRAEVEERGRRMEMMRADMSVKQWNLFVHYHPEAASWFDKQGKCR